MYCIGCGVTYIKENIWGHGKKALIILSDWQSSWIIENQYNFGEMIKFLANFKEWIKIKIKYWWIKLNKTFWWIPLQNSLSMQELFWFCYFIYLIIIILIWLLVILFFSFPILVMPGHFYSCLIQLRALLRVVRMH